MVVSYGLFASLSTFLKQDMGRYLQPILKHMLETLRSTEGFVVREREVEISSHTIPDPSTVQVLQHIEKLNGNLFVFSFDKTHYNGDEDPAFLIDDENIQQEHGEDSDDDSVTG